MTDLQLFKNCKIDNINRVSSFKTLQAQNAYYAGLISNQNGINSTAINFQRMGDPIVLKYDYDEVLNYNYGRIKLKDVWYYFSITDLRVVQKELTQIIYRIDPWETARLQMNLSIGRGLVERGTITDDNIKYWLPQNELQPRMLTYSKTPLIKADGYHIPTGLTDDLAIITVTGSDEIGMNVNMIKCNNIVGFLQHRKLTDVLKRDKRNLQEGKMIPSNIRGAWIIPFTIIRGSLSETHKLNEFNPDDFEPDHENIGYTLYGVFRGYGDKVGEQEYATSTNDPFDFRFTLGTPLKHTDTERTFITDMRGNELYSPPYGYTADNQRVYVEANISYNTCIFRCFVGNQGRTNPEHRFTVMGEPVPLMGSSFTEYSARQRQTDIEGRRIARNEQLAKGLLSTATSTATGYILGGIGGAGGASAGVAGGGSIVESLGGYMIDKHITSPQQQAMLDNHYHRQFDELLLQGDAHNSFVPMQIVTESWDDYSKTRFNNYIAVNGYSVNHYLTDCSSFYIPNGTLKGDFEIDGNVPESWKVAIREKFLKGVRIIE